MSHPSTQLAVTLGSALLIASLLAPITMNQCSEMEHRANRESQAAEHIQAANEALPNPKDLSKGVYAAAVIAEKAYTQALNLQPTNEEARRGLYRAQAIRIINASESVSKEDAYGLLYRFDIQQEKDADYQETYRLALGALYTALGDLDGAKTAFENATSGSEPSSKAWGQRGSFELAQLEYAAATASYEKSLAADSDNHASRLGLGIALKKQDKVKRAIEELSRASEALKGPKVWYELGDAHLLNGDFAQAYTALESARKQHAQWNKDASLLKRLGVAAYKTDKFGVAVQYLQSAAKVEPSLETLLNLGIAYHKTGGFGAAAQTLNRVIQANPADAEARSYLMSSLVKLNKIPEARQVGLDFIALAQNRPSMQQDAVAIQGMLQQLKGAETKSVPQKRRPRLPPPQRGGSVAPPRSTPPQFVPVPGDTVPPPIPSAPAPRGSDAPPAFVPAAP